MSRFLFVFVLLMSMLRLSVEESNENKAPSLLESKEAYSPLSPWLQREKRSRVNSICPSGCTCQARGNQEKIVECDTSGKTRIPENIPGDATNVNLAHNQIEVVAAQPLTELTHIKIMDLSYNRIKAIEKNAFQYQYRVEWLDLSNNLLSNISLPDFSEAARSLKVLNFSNTNLNKFPKLHDDRAIFMSKLETLVLSNNNFTSVPPNHIPRTVKTLHLSCLGLSELFAASFEGLQELQELVVRGCSDRKNIHSVEDGTLNFPKLQKLDLSANSLTTIPRGLSASLLYLDLSNNRIRSIKSGPCASQEEIFSIYSGVPGRDYSDRGVAVGSELSRLVNLIELHLNDNSIFSLCADDFIFMQQLQILNLTNCKLKSFHPDTFLYTQTLRILDLSSNFINKLEITELPDLEELYFERNSISEVIGISRSKLPSLRKADFSYNRYTCDCNLRAFVQFLGGSYAKEVRFRYLSATSKRYECFRPQRLRGKPLMSVDINTELTCDEEATTINWAAIAAPSSLFCLIVIIVLVITLWRFRKRLSICSCCCWTKDSVGKKKVTSSHAKFEPESDIVIQNKPVNDLAILCHDANHRWILNTMVPNLNQTQTKSDAKDTSSPEENKQAVKRSLNVEVFTIGKTIRIENLHRCININRKLALIITHEFLQEKSCRFILKVIHDRLQSDPKDAVLCVVMDTIPWAKMPETLQKLMTEKTFLQFPHVDRGRQELYFWDNLNALLLTSESKPSRPWLTEEEEVVTGTRCEQSYEEEERETRRSTDTIRSTNRARRVDRNGEEHISAARAARLQRLGIKSNGEVVDGVLAGIEEAKNLAKRNLLKHENAAAVNEKPMLMSQPSSFVEPTMLSTPSTPTPHPKITTVSQTVSTQLNDDLLQRDIDDLYSTRKDLYRFGGSRSNGRMRSLLPPNCEDADSIYSDEGECPLPGYDVRPPERGHFMSKEHGKSKHLRSHHKRRREEVTEEKQHQEESDVMDNLHGTVAENPEEQLADDVDAVEKDDSAETEEKTSRGNKQKKKNRIISRLQSFF